MWWTMAVSAAMLLNLALGIHVLWPNPRRWLVLAWSLAMLAVTGWYTAGAYQLAEGLSAFSDGFQRAFGGRGDQGSRAAQAPPSAPEAPPASPAPTWPRKWDQFPVQPESPVALEVMRVEPARFAGIDVRVRLTNTRSDATVDGVRFDVWCFDNFGDVQSNGLTRHPGFGMVDQQTIAPGQNASGTWSIRFGANNCTRARAWVRSVHFLDGGQWEAPETPAATAPAC